MTVRRINFTERIRIKREDLKFMLSNQDGQWNFDASINLSKYRLPLDGLVFIEAYRQTSWMRFDYGTVSRLVPPYSRLLSEFGNPDGIHFRVKIVCPDTDRKIIIAEADGIQPVESDSDDANRISLLPVRGEEGLGQLPFQLNYDDGPLLLINTRLRADWKEVVQHPAFISLSLPSIFREVLQRVLLVDEIDDTEGIGWQSQWLKLAISMPGMSTLVDLHDKEKLHEWIDDAVNAFCKSYRIVEKSLNFWEQTRQQ